MEFELAAVMKHGVAVLTRELLTTARGGSVRILDHTADVGT